LRRNTAKRGENEAHRAAIIRLLVPLYPGGMTFAGLQQALMIERRPLDSRELDFHLAYLEESNYLVLDKEPARRGRRQKTLHAKAARKAVDLLDGRIPEDTGIAL